MTPRSMPPRAEATRLLTLKEAAERLGCSVKSVRRRIAAGSLPVIRDGRLVRIDPEDLRRFIATCRMA